MSGFPLRKNGNLCNSHSHRRFILSRGEHSPPSRPNDNWEKNILKQLFKESLRLFRPLSAGSLGRESRQQERFRRARHLMTNSTFLIRWRFGKFLLCLVFEATETAKALVGKISEKFAIFCYLLRKKHLSLRKLLFNFRKRNFPILSRFKFSPAVPRAISGKVLFLSVTAYE